MATCDECGHEPERYPVCERQNLYECEVCGRTRCEKCLERAADSVDAAPSYECDADALMYRHPETGAIWCPICWHDEDGKA